jgi:hypothetical protein
MTGYQCREKNAGEKGRDHGETDGTGSVVQRCFAGWCGVPRRVWRWQQEQQLHDGCDGHPDGQAARGHGGQPEGRGARCQVVHGLGHGALQLGAERRGRDLHGERPGTGRNGSNRPNEREWQGDAPERRGERRRQQSRVDRLQWHAEHRECQGDAGRRRCRHRRGGAWQGAVKARRVRERPRTSQSPCPAAPGTSKPKPSATGFPRLRCGRPGRRWWLA